MLAEQVDRLIAGEVGYLAASIKQVADARVGDTITLKKDGATQPLPGVSQLLHTAVDTDRGGRDS